MKSISYTGHTWKFSTLPLGIQEHTVDENRGVKPRLHEHQVPNPDSNLDHNPHGRGGLSLDLNPVLPPCKRNHAVWIRIWIRIPV